MDLISVISEIKRKITRSEAERKQAVVEVNETYDKQRTMLENALKVNLELNTVCLNCEGQKEIDVGRYDRMWATCDRCNGTGIEPKEEQ